MRSSKTEVYAREVLAARGWLRLYHNVEILGVQVDLLMKNPAGVVCVLEVKSQGRTGLARLSLMQRRRLLRVTAFLSHWEAVELHLVLVEGARISVLPVV